ncbi:MAG: hypothetical protein L0241_17160 [Planctomycetia bacterium]|nr:hypothetical protein [Planctomycetia bacterium]
MKRFLRWLNPNRPLSGAVFGFVFGFIAVQSLFITFALQDGTFKGLRFHLLAGALYAIPWVLLWAGSGAVCGAIPGHPGTLSTLLAIACGIGYSVWEGPKLLDPWLPMKVPFYTFIAMFPCHWLGCVIAALFGRIRDPEETQ